MSPVTLIVRYSAFAALAMGVNLALQGAVLSVLSGPVGLGCAVVAGTGGGLVVKYLLDKVWIFQDREQGLTAHGRKFLLYTLMGLGTTGLFWATETLFYLLFRTEGMMMVGAALGLTVGYVVKYHLDRAFVFRRSVP
ncbi:GtrA family protein [Novispirillum itersonii]|uniref:Putative flippase GtrA n=1 Tax=Novispirillum itersonii TaxID=189 RepID=A0A7X0DMA7_NOVIT|nr:GtrA family protein [Novispirillum itersonii]MBB6210780.1 putative flippase GtrA [Novispirillum itersonii]